MLFSSVIPVLLSIIMLNTHAEALDLTNCKKEWVTTDFASYEYRVDCSNLGFTRIPDKLPKLTSQLTLNGNSISSVDQASFDGLTSLHSVDLSGNDIVYLEEDAFEDSLELKVLDLSRNKLRCDWRIWWLVSYAKKIKSFTGDCFTPRALRGRDIKTLKQEDLAVDCLSVKKLTGSKKDGEYEMRVFGHDNRMAQIYIYCHEMDTSFPTEFLPLPSGVKNNYVEIIEDKTCSYSEELQEAIEASNRTTYFSYVKIDLSRLRLIANDTSSLNPRSQITFGKPTICDRDMCTMGIAAVDLRGTPFQLMDTKSPLQVSKCYQKCGLCHFPDMLTLKIVNSKKNPFGACTLPLGMQSRGIPDLEITATSHLREYSPSHARLNSLMHFGWCAGNNDNMQEIIIHLGKKMTLSGISTQGHKTLPSWVTSYELLYSEDGKNYMSYKEIGVKKIFDANYNRYIVVTHWFRPRFIARFVKLKPLSWNNNICTRIELYGCVSDINSYIMQKIPEDRCLTIGERVYDKNGSPQYPLVQKLGCEGPDYMFTFHSRRLQHTKTGLCLHLTDQSWFIFNKTCSSTNLMFQKVASSAAESFLIKDTNGYCARIQETDNKLKNKIFSIWRTCQRGGFTIFKLSREGVAAFSPIFQIKRTTLVTDLFKPVELSCRARAEPFPLYEWSRNGTIPDGNVAITDGVTVHSKHVTLTIRNVTWQDRGLYVCNAWNSKGYEYKEYEVVVNPMQWFETTPENQKAIHGDDARFDCVSKGIPYPKVSWFTFDESILEQRNVLDMNKMKFSVAANGSLSISNVRYTDEKTYICISESPGLKRNATAKLDVYVTQKFTRTPVDQRVLYGSQVIFNCISEGRPKPKVSWKINSIDIDSTMATKYEILSNGSLVVKSAVIAAEGTYECVSTSPGLLRSAPAVLSVYVTQEFKVSPTPTRTLYGFTASFECESIGVPTPKVTWRRKFSKTHSALVTNGDKYVIFDNNTLHVRDVNYADEAIYICVSQSPRLMKKAEASLSVYVTQKFSKRPESQTVIENAPSTVFSCLSDGIPKPKISWSFKSSLNGRIKTFKDIKVDPRYTVEENNELAIRNVRNEDEGEYFCISESPRLVVNTSAVLTVHTLPVLSITTKNVTVFTSQSIHVTCSATGDPKPNIKWYKNVAGKKVPVSDIAADRLTNEDGTLTLKKAEKQDQGAYVCVASNSAGEREEVVLVHVTVLCLMEDISYIKKPKKYVYAENERVRITCKKGFQQVGYKDLTCQSNGLFNHPFPKCQDIDECDTEPGSGSVDMSTSSPSIDDEPEVCDYNAQCKNTIGSFECICNEGYVMRKNKCEFSPPGSKSKNPGPDKPSATEPPPRDYSLFEKTIEFYRSGILDEEMYLRKLYTFARNISGFQYFSWRKDALYRMTTQALNATIEKKVDSILPIRTASNLMELYASIISLLLDDNYKDEWGVVNRESCGTVCLMRYLEQYIVKISSSTVKSFKEGIDFQSDSFNLKLASVNDTFKEKDFSVTLMSDTQQGNNAIIPKDNYHLIKGSTSIAIRYKTLQNLLPQPRLKGLKESKILSDVFSLSFTSLKNSQKLVEPAKIIFKVPKSEDSIIDQSVCTYWDFGKGKYGGWSTEGCVVSNTSTPTEIICECDHLTNFAILIPKKSIKMIHLTLGIAVAAGVGLCILLAFITCFSHVCCSHYTNSDRKAVLINITLTIILGMLIFVGGIFLSSLDLVPQKYSQYYCYTIIGCLQLFGCAFFAWIFAEAVHLYLSTRIVINKGNGRLALFYFIGWGIPIMIVAITGVLVYFDKSKLQSRCVMNISLYLIGILVGGPSLLYIIATFVVYVMIRVSLASDKELLNARVVFHAKGVMLCSFCLLLLHVLVLGSATMFLKFNSQIVYHYIFAALTAAEGLYLVFYHCYVDRRAGITRRRSKKRNSYSAKDTITYSPNGASSNTEIAEEATTNEQNQLIKRSSKRSLSSEVRPPHLEVRNNSRHQHSSEETLEWDSAYQGMYGGGGGGMTHGGLADTPHSSRETRPLISKRSDTFDETDGAVTPSTFRAGSISKNSTLSRNSTLPKRWKDIDEVDYGGHFRQPVKRTNSKASSIVSVETHTSSNTHQGLPVYFPAPPPHYEMSLDRNKKDIHIDSYASSENNSRRGSFGIESDRMSNISSELSNILYELQAFDTNRPKDSPSEHSGHTSNTLPHRHEPPMTDISQNPMSTFRPTTNNKGYARTEVAFEESKPPSYTDHQRVRILRGKSRQEADPSDGLHSHSGSMYSSL